MWCMELIPNSCSQGAFLGTAKTKNLVCDSSLRTPQPLQTAQVVITFYFVKTKLQMDTQMTVNCAEGHKSPMFQKLKLCSQNHQGRTTDERSIFIFNSRYNSLI